MSKQTKLDQKFRQVRRSDRISRKSKDVFPEAKDPKTVKDQDFKPEHKVSEEEMKMLRDFDHNSEFGPCIDLTRMERWNRASKFGKSPPIEVKDILLKYPEDIEVTESIWSGHNL